ncbi:unnamed protein product [Rotaria sp. Silwood2]|nr:unnamed protein product [Rotaria sp. Silwood2]CAF3341412.1 unnamed protein product [Rotaria sp. Silwood2]CAF4265589.1 unnamed protein product [Rotaria sp. Silwood2]CAF4386728.1 unnamed protein product [Rotaria sp. Silwood2]CAF4509073.1 unnamed protein product [Rotaria sp. Silwood2]
MIFLSRGIWVSKGVRCCSNHLYKEHLSYEARQSVKQSKADDILLNKHDVEKLIDDFRLTLKHAGSLDFDDPGALDNETYKTITGLDRGPFFTDSLNNDAAILKHCILNDEQQVLSWLRDNDVLVLDRGFRDTVNALNRLGLKVAIPGFLHNQKQLPADEANRIRFVTKNRWVIESGKI